MFDSKENVTARYNISYKTTKRTRSKQNIMSRKLKYNI